MEFPLFYQKKIVLTLLVASCGAFPGFRASGERINQEGRILGPAPAVTNSILFNTPEADAIVSAMQIFPPDNPWNEDISRRPALTNSDAMIQQIMSDLLSTRRAPRAFYEMNFVLVPDDQPLVPVNFFNYSDESDPSPYPIPLSLPMFPALVRYDECEGGRVEHALRLVVKHTRAEFIYPARHYASVPYATNANVPAMGQRLRLKSSFVIPDNWTVQEKAVLRAFKKYGALVADNGNFFSVSVTPDDRWPGGAFDHLSTISLTNFEVIQTTGPTEGPRP